MTQFQQAVRELKSRTIQFHEEDDLGNTSNKHDNGVSDITSYDADEGKRKGDGLVMLKVCGWYKRVLEEGRLKGVDVKLNSGWWSGSSSVGRLKNETFKVLGWEES